MPVESSRPRPNLFVVETVTGDLEPRTLEQAISDASKPVKIIPGTPQDGFPPNARAGQLIQFESEPSSIYVLGPDNIWRASPLVPVL